LVLLLVALVAECLRAFLVARFGCHRGLVALVAREKLVAKNRFAVRFKIDFNARQWPANRFSRAGLYDGYPGRNAPLKTDFNATPKIGTHFAANCHGFNERARD
jgi:hypothetical protein